MPRPSSDYELGRSYRTSLRQVAEPDAKTRQAELLDLLGDDRTLLAPLRNLVESPNFHDSIIAPSVAVRHARRDALLDELRSWCNQEALSRIGAFLSGALDFPSSQESIYSAVQEDSESHPESSGDSADNPSSTDLEQNTASAKASNASSTRIGSGCKSTEEAIAELSTKAHSACLSGEHQRSIDLLTEALRIDPAKADLYMQRASLHAKNQDAGSAIQDFTSVLRLEPNNHAARAHRGQAHALMGAKDAAVNDWEQAASAGHPQAIQWLSIILLDEGKRLLESRSYHKAIDTLSQAIRIAPGNAELYYLRGKVNQAISHHGLAVIDFSATIRLDPSHASAYAQRGKSYQHEGRPASALSDWKTAVHLGHPEALKWRVEAERLSENASTSDASVASQQTVSDSPEPKSKHPHEASGTFISTRLAPLLGSVALGLALLNGQGQVGDSSSTQASVGAQQAMSELLQKAQVKSQEAVLVCEHQEVIVLLEQINPSVTNSSQNAIRGTPAALTILYQPAQGFW